MIWDTAFASSSPPEEIHRAVDIGRRPLTRGVVTSASYWNPTYHNSGSGPGSHWGYGYVVAEVIIAGSLDFSVAVYTYLEVVHGIIPITTSFTTKLFSLLATTESHANNHHQIPTHTDQRSKINASPVARETPRSASHFSFAPWSSFSSHHIRDHRRCRSWLHPPW
jgi:hypothetical protein